jgi:hypothetical protein
MVASKRGAAMQEHSGARAVSRQQRRRVRCDAIYTSKSSAMLTRAASHRARGRLAHKRCDARGGQDTPAAVSSRHDRTARNAITPVHHPQKRRVFDCGSHSLLIGTLLHISTTSTQRITLSFSCLLICASCLCKSNFLEDKNEAMRVPGDESP